MPRSVAYDVIFFKGFIFFLHFMALQPLRQPETGLHPGAAADTTIA